MRSFYKRPLSALLIQLDFRMFVEAVAPTVVSMTLRAEPGVTVAADVADGVVTLTVTGGIVGRQYAIAVEANTPDGQAEVQSALVRVREVAGWPSLPPVGPVVPGGFIPNALYVDGLLVAIDGQPLLVTSDGGLALLVDGQPLELDGLPIQIT